MATTKILPVRKRLKDCLDYAANPKKTEIFRGDALDRLMHYTQNEDKTEHQLYVTGFNCDPQNACLIMEATKRRWHKDIVSLYEKQIEFLPLHEPNLVAAEVIFTLVG